ncbi:hypothetical protein [Lysobacter gummosus]|uniref:hypothetical protein n=1 Tax=Lysobacter gummosus TaxID=262324 RepID=UPI00364236D8
MDRSRTSPAWCSAIHPLAQSAHQRRCSRNAATNHRATGRRCSWRDSPDHKYGTECGRYRMSNRQPDQTARRSRRSAAPRAYRQPASRRFP